LLYQTYRAGDEIGLRLLASLAVAGGGLLLYLAQPGATGFAVAAAATSLAATSVDVSTSLFAWPLLAFTVLSLSSLRERNKWWLLSLPPILGAWPYLNRDASVGLALLAVALVIEFGRGARWLRHCEPAERGRTAQYLLLVLAVGAATVILITVTPQGWHKIANPFDEVAAVQSGGLPHWNGVSLNEDPLFFLLAFLTGLLALVLPPLGMPFEALAAAGFLFLSLLSRHFVSFFAALAVPIAARALSILGERLSSSRVSLARRLTRPSVAILLGVALCLPTALARPQAHPFELSLRVLEEHGLGGPLFNLPEAGGLATWMGGSELLPFAYLRPKSVEAFQELGSHRSLSQILDEQQIELVLVGRAFADRHRVELLDNGDLSLLFFDDAALLYGRAGQGVSTLKILRYFDPLKDPEEYPEDVVPLATEELFRHFDHYPPSSRTWWDLGRLLLRAERREEALEAFEAAHRLSPRDLRTLRTLSRLYIEKGMYGLAENSAQKALRLTEDEELRYNLALSVYGQGDYPAAAREFERVLELNRENLKARRALVDIYRQLGKLDDSFVQMETLTAKEDAAIASLLSQAEERKQALDFAGAADFYQRALEIRSDEPTLLWELALILLTDNQTEAAGLAMRDLLAVAPRHAEARLTLGVLCAQEPECTSEEASTHLEAFLTLAPDDLNAELAKKELGNLK
jgi:tetratricopeptide (TPR) repeat protein